MSSIRRLWDHFAVWTLFVVIGAPLAFAQIQVDSATPGAAPQGTVNLNVTISGKGFKSGAKVQWFVTGTTNPGGVTVNSVKVQGATALTANINVALDAILGGYDIVVTNTDGRTGKGTDRFAVSLKGTPVGCSTTGTPSGLTLVTQLNAVQPNGAALIGTLGLGNSIRVRPVDLNHDGTIDSLVVFVTSGTISGATASTYAFLLDPATGQLQSVNPVTGATWSNPQLLLTGVRAILADAGDVNGDGIPDFAMAISADSSTYLFVGAVNPSTFNLSYTPYHIQAPANAPASWGTAIALGDLDGDGKDEIAIGATPGKKGSNNPAVYIFRYVSGSLSIWQTIQGPTGAGGFGSAIAIGNIDGGTGNDLAIGAPGANTSGAVYVFPAPLQQSSLFTVTGAGPGFGRGLGIADMNLDGNPDLLVIAGDQFSGSDTTAQAFIFAGNVHAGSGYTNDLLPAPGLAYSWASPNLDLTDIGSSGAIIIGTPNANNPGNGSSCTIYVGAAHLFTSPFGATEKPNYVLEPPVITGDGMDYGYGVAVVPGSPFIVVGAKLANVGTTKNAGQVYVYKKN
jgi:hypothetical protein